jgi:DamX protein
MQYDNQERESDHDRFEQESAEQTDETMVSEVRHAEESHDTRQNWLMTPLIVLGVLVLALLLLYQAEISAWISGKPATTEVASEARVEVPLQPENVTAETAPVSGDAGIEVITNQAGNTELPTTEVASVATAPVATAPTVQNSSVVTVTPLEPSAPPKTETKAVEAKTATTSTTSAATAVIETKPPVTEKKPEYSGDEQALLALNSAHYVVQIIGLSDEKAVKQFASQNGLKKARYYRALRNGKTMYFLVQPEYADHAAADKARDALPEAVRKQKPWVKQVKLIQQEIRSAVKAR